MFQNILDRKIDWPEEDVCEVSPEAKDLMNRLMCINPRDRLGANPGEKFPCGGEEIRNHAWFIGIDWQTLRVEPGDEAAATALAFVSEATGG